MTVRELRLALELVPQDAEVTYVDTLERHLSLNNDSCRDITNVCVQSKALVILR